MACLAMNRVVQSCVNRSCVFILAFLLLYVSLQPLFHYHVLVGLYGNVSLFIIIFMIEYR